MDQGAHIPPEEGWSSHSHELSESCFHYYLKGAKEAVKNGANLGYQGLYGVTALHEACYGSEPKRGEIVAWILSQPDGLATIDLTTYDGDSALCYARRYENNDVIQVLLEHGAKGNQSEE